MVRAVCRFLHLAFPCRATGNACTLNVQFLPVGHGDGGRVVLGKWGTVLGGDLDVFEGEVFAVGGGDAGGAGEGAIGEGDIFNVAFFEAFDGAALADVDGGDVIDVDVAEEGRAFGERLDRRLRHRMVRRTARRF